MVAIDVQQVSKTFRIPHERHTTLLERAAALFRPTEVEILPALTDVTFQVEEGACLGVVGANGSGKSTLLKVIAGILVPDAGRVQVAGSLAPLLELGLGFHPELSARDNVTLYGAVLGYPPKHIGERVAQALAFAELERFADAKLKSLSSGMIVRLAFATAVLADADVLLLDEVLAVGDAQFQKKCFDAFADLRRRGKTVVLVSHDLGSVQRLCDTVAWMERGRLVAMGPADSVTQAYLTAARTVAPSGASEHEEDRAGRFGAQHVRFVRGALRGTDGARATEATTGERVTLHAEVEFRRAAQDPVFGIGVRRLGVGGGPTIYSINNQLLGLPSGTFAEGDRLAIEIPFTAALVNGDYSITVAIAERLPGDEWITHDWITDFVTFTVAGSACEDGQADLFAEFRSVASRADAPPDVRGRIGGIP